jgi:hypothetical protein
MRVATPPMRPDYHPGRHPVHQAFATQRHHQMSSIPPPAMSQTIGITHIAVYKSLGGVGDK